MPGPVLDIESVSVRRQAVPSLGQFLFQTRAQILNHKVRNELSTTLLNRSVDGCTESLGSQGRLSGGSVLPTETWINRSNLSEGRIEGQCA